MQIRAAELTADNLSRIVRIDHDDDTFVVGRLVKIRHRRFGDAGAHDIDTRVVIEVLGDQRVAKRFDAIGVVELLKTCRSGDRALATIEFQCSARAAFLIINERSP